MIVGDDAFVMLLVEARFGDFTTERLCDPTTHTGALLALSVVGRADVDGMGQAAVAAGGSHALDPADQASCTRGASTTRAATPGRSHPQAAAS